MREIILLKLGEIVLKGLNKRRFEEKLMSNIRKSLENCGKFNMKIAQSTIYIFPSDEFEFDKAVENLKCVFGIVSIVTCGETEKDINKIKAFACEYLKDVLNNVKTFKCEAKRSDKAFPLKSPEICMELGGHLLENFPHLKVDVKNPDVVVYTEVRDYGAFVHAGRIQGAGGMPVGSNGKACLLLSGGIDSPVAGYMTAKRGVSLEAVHFYSYPYTSERAKDKVIKLARIIARYTGKFKLYVVPFTKPQLEIYEKCPDEELTVIMRCIMMKIAEALAKKHGSLGLITGESIGQVASQTLEALAVTDASVSMPVIRPLIGMDKEEIVTISKKIGAFETSILPYEDCCTVFVPKHPKTKPQLEKILQSEKLLDIDAIIDDCVNNVEVITIEPLED
ncbi:MAG: tRNA 4-thiouridine(8) synthase ThiI [Clostridia bacterium]|nr:tRNA 4-thiouridine(8) synthase ThiI [Clostridia bacterium]